MIDPPRLLSIGSIAIPRSPSPNFLKLPVRAILANLRPCRPLSNCEGDVDRSPDNCRHLGMRPETDASITSGCPEEQ